MGMFSRNHKDDQPAPFDVNALEDELRIATPMYYPRNLDEPPVPMPRDLDERLPQVVYRKQQPFISDEPLPTAEDLGRITSEAIQKFHRETAEALTALGKSIEDRIARIELIKHESQQQLAEIKELAEKHNDAGKEMSLQVESAANDLAESRNMIESMRKKVAS